MKTHQNPSDEQSDFNRAAAIEEIEYLKSMRSTAWDEHTHSFRWLMASLLAVNGGACVASFNSEMIGIHGKIVSGGFFVIGIVLSMLIAVFGQKSVQKSFLPVQKFIGYWMTVAIDGMRDLGIEAELSDDLQKSARWGSACKLAGWAAAIAFVCGALASGYSLMDGANTAVPDCQTKAGTAADYD